MVNPIYSLVGFTNFYLLAVFFSHRSKRIWRSNLKFLLKLWRNLLNQPFNLVFNGFLKSNVSGETWLKKKILLPPNSSKVVTKVSMFDCLLEKWWKSAPIGPFCTIRCLWCKKTLFHICECAAGTDRFTN